MSSDRDSWRGEKSNHWLNSVAGAQYQLLAELAHNVCLARDMDGRIVAGLYTKTLLPSLAIEHF